LLLAVVIGWLQVSLKYDSIRLAIAMDKANRIAHVASDDGVVLARNRPAFSPSRPRPLRCGNYYDDL